MLPHNDDTYSRFEASDLFVGQSIGLGNDRNQIDLGMQTAHDLNIQGFQGVASGLDEKHASMNTVVNNVHAVDFVFGVEVRIVTLLDVVDDGPPRLIVVHEISEAGGINHSQA